MRSKRGFDKDIIIDLTSLLDVVFILLLVIITQFQNEDAKVQAARNAAVEAQSQAAHSKEIYDTQVENMQGVSQYIEFISVISTFNEETLSERRIDVNFSGEKRDVTIELDGRNVQDKYDELKNMIREYRDANPEKMIVLSLNENSEEILYMDEKAIRGVFTELLEDGNGNVKIRENTAGK